MFCSISRLFVCLRMRMSTSKQYANVYVKSIFIGPRSIAGVPLNQAAPAYLITAHHLCAFLLYLVRQLCDGFQKKKKPNIPTSPVSSFPVEDHLGGTPLWACGGENYDWSAAWGSACLGLYVCIFCLCQWRLVCAVLADVDPVGLASVSIKDGTA